MSQRLRLYLDQHYRSFDYARYRERDPVRFVERFRGGDPREIEVAGYLAASLAYGQVGIVLGHVRELLDRMGNAPLAYVQAIDPKSAKREWRTFRHRFNDGDDVVFLLLSMKRVLEEHGSLQAVVRRGMQGDIASGLAELSRALAATDPRPVFGTRELPSSARFLLTSPEDGSTCKRLFMFARWMVRRPDAVCPIDFGIWDSIAPGQLILPLDTHTGRLVRYLGLTTRKRSLGLAMAREVTRGLARLDPDDPVKYDFALAHIGISKQCLHRRVARICGQCPLEQVCRIGRPRRSTAKEASPCD